jgi:hypothetical protein
MCLARLGRLLGYSEVGGETFVSLFEIDLGWAPRLDGSATFARMLVLTNEMTRFERRGIYAARVRNASTMGSQLFLFQISAI